MFHHISNVIIHKVKQQIITKLRLNKKKKNFFKIFSEVCDFCTEICRVFQKKSNVILQNILLKYISKECISSLTNNTSIQV